MEITIHIDAYRCKLARARTAEEENNLTGPSPGGAASELRISRQAVHEAIARGRLDAYRVTYDSEGKELSGIYVTRASLDRYKAARDLRSSRSYGCPAIS